MGITEIGLLQIDVVMLGSGKYAEKIIMFDDRIRANTKTSVMLLLSLFVVQSNAEYLGYGGPNFGVKSY